MSADRSALIRQFWKAFDVYKQAPGNYHDAKLGADSARWVGVIIESYEALRRLARRLGLSAVPPRYTTDKWQNDRTDWYPWLNAVDDFRIDAEALLTEPAIPPDGDLADYRNGPGGKLLTVEVILDAFAVSGATLSQHRKAKETRKKNPHGRGFVYRYDVVSLIANQKR
jgi:hypothetical protein